jgi:alkylation response protein AidB-like acyl-CoA dehydrogenase
MRRRGEHGQAPRVGGVVAGGERLPRHARRLRLAQEYHVERKFRETRLYSVAPVSNNLILAYLGQHVLGLPRSY